MKTLAPLQSKGIMLSVRLSMKTIPLTQGKVAIVDDEDFDNLIKYKWFLDNGYARGRVNGKYIFMHRFIMKTKRGEIYDHINRNKLDNRKSNMRKCTYSQNAVNAKYNFHNKVSKYRGVCWSKEMSLWKASIRVNTKAIHLGFFENEIDAAKIYDSAARHYFDNFAYLNFPNMKFYWKSRQKYFRSSHSDRFPHEHFKKMSLLGVKARRNKKVFF